jgi:hypothetical protein
MVSPSKNWPLGVTLANWDLGGEPSAWAYLHAADLLPSVEIPVSRPAVALANAEDARVGEFEVEPGVSLDRYVAEAPVSGIVVVQVGSVVFERYPRSPARTAPPAWSADTAVSWPSPWDE